MRFTWDFVRFAWDLLEICMRLAWDLLEMCLRLAWDLPENCLRFALHFSEICMKFACNLHEIYMIFTWDLCEIYGRVAWDLSEVCMRFDTRSYRKQVVSILKLFDQWLRDRERLAIPIGARAPKNYVDSETVPKEGRGIAPFPYKNHS